MDNEKFKTRTFGETLRLLCIARGAPFIRAGEVNQSEIARRSKARQPSVGRWLRGEVSPHDENVRKLAKAFRVTPAQMRGEVPIYDLDGIEPKTELDRTFLEKYQAAPDWLRRSWMKQLSEYLEDQDERDPPSD